MTIHKQILSFGVNYYTLPGCVELLSVIEQHNKIVLYYLVDTEVLDAYVRIDIFATGSDVPFAYPQQRHFLGTVKLDGGSLVYHIFHNH
jgi:hypothetical protein